VIEIEAQGLGGLGAAALSALPCVQNCDLQEAKVTLKVSSLHGALPPLLSLLRERGTALDGLSTRHATLEDVFVHLTGRQLREDQGA
jgi:ABC-2 type transport system ATP-binding protein